MQKQFVRARHGQGGISGGTHRSRQSQTQRKTRYEQQQTCAYAFHGFLLRQYVLPAGPDMAMVFLPLNLTPLPGISAS